MKNETGTLCKSYFHLSQFSEFAKLNSASCEFGVEITFSNEAALYAGELIQIFLAGYSRLRYNKVIPLRIGLV